MDSAAHGRTAVTPDFHKGSIRCTKITESGLKLDSYVSKMHVCV